MQRSNLVIGCALLALSAFALAWVIPAHTVPVTSPLDIQASFMPALACWIVAALAAVLVGRETFALLRGRRDEEDDGDEFRGEATGFRRKELVRLLIWAAFSVVAVFGLKHLGFLITAPALLAGVMLYAGCRQPVLLAAVSLLAPLLIYQIVWQAFTVSLP